LGESAVVPDVTVVRETVANITQSTLLDILFDRVEGLFFRDLHFGVGPAGNLDDHVEDAIVLVSEEGDVVPWAEGGLSCGRFEVSPMLWEKSDRAGRDERSLTCYASVSIERGGDANRR